MLRVTPSASADRAKSYFTSGLAKGDYYARDGADEVPGRWGGEAAKRLGLRGEVTQKAFFRLAENRHPGSDAPLTARTRAGRRVGYDFTFSVPKSVSVLHAYSGDSRILEAFRECVQETMREMEAKMKARVRVGANWDKNVDRVTGNMVWADFVHLTSRPVAGVPDPHLHAHVFAFNATFDTVEGRWKAGQFAGLKRDAAYHEAAFDSRMALRLGELGYGVVHVGGKRWEVSGVPETVVRRFSRRQAQVEAAAKAQGIRDPEAKHRIAERTRERKSRALSGEKLRAAWRERLTPDERAALDRVIAHRGRGERRPGETPAEVIDRALLHVFERQSVVREVDVLEAALRFGVGSVAVEAARVALHKRPDVIRRELRDEAVCSTKDVLEEELALLDFVRFGKNTHRPFAEAPFPSSRVREKGAKLELSEDQKAAITHVLQSSDRVTAIRGGAGTGKTTLMTAVVQGIERSSHQRVYPLAPTAAAVDVLREKEGFTNSHTVARFLIDDAIQAEARGQVIWVDEAGQLGTRDLARICAIAEKEGARVILSGDIRQHGSVPRGDALRLLETHAGLSPVELSTIRRQTVNEYREAVAAIARGDIARGFDRLDSLGLIREVPDAEGRYRELAAKYVETTARGDRVLVVAPTHAEGEQATAAIRDALARAGRLGAEHDVMSLRNRNLTEAERRFAGSYRPGDVVQVMQNVPGHVRGERLVVRHCDEEGRVYIGPGEKDILPLERARHFQVFEARRLEVAVGDRIRITQNGQAGDRSRVLNGSVYEVEDFLEEGRGKVSLRLKNGKSLPSDFGHIAHGFVTTSHSAQGRTADHVLIAQSRESLGASSREQWYVSVSRGRRGVTVYTDDKKSLREAVERSSERTAAIEMLEEGKEVEKATARSRELERILERYRAAGVLRTSEARLQEVPAPADRPRRAKAAERTRDER